MIGNLPVKVSSCSSVRSSALPSSINSSNRLPSGQICRWHVDCSRFGGRGPPDVLRIIRNFFCVASSNGRAAARDSTEPSVWLPRINRYLAVPRSLVKLLILLKRRDLARSHSIAELLPLEFHEYKWAANGEQTSCKSGAAVPAAVVGASRTHMLGQDAFALRLRSGQASRKDAGAITNIAPRPAPGSLP
jgi:hypothetical protein